ncbi:hypothetical protein A3J15_02390 [Candidatus Roizmanbacteria bacterium RIFCSPLOWO2_02_FULL_38_10]|uniref:Uncharacterized protein n=1 Tax=Candidatus Roizmanbacteria bacterium RIFCSPLOWO2_02_FULL_38_10 TaxID=1802074 RepID=A0A1F7JMC1_9BACT|nr:MAG: hypothetical protein A3J15_02390 [Candidatus Roizmanbacteria bacterium RIFCSPLOWO2_02_FULL_38_10]
MVRLTKQFQDKQDLHRMEEVLFEVLSSYNWKDEFEGIMTEFFTVAERKMFAKRIFIMFLLYKKVPYYDIARALKTSTSTISRYILLLADQNLVLKKIFKRIEQKERLINMLDDLFTIFFIHPGIYKNHWSFYRDYQARVSRRKTSGI